MKVSRYILLLIVASLMTLMVIYPEVYVKSAYNGLIIFCINVLPALFPFFFFSKLLTLMGAADGIASIAKKPMRFLYNSPPVGAYVFGISILSGYPVGAKLLSDLYGENALNSNECKKISTFCSTGGPLFIVGTVGALLGNKTASYIILAAHILGTLLNGLLYRNIMIEKDSSPKLLQASPDKILSESINSAIQSILIVGGYIAIFYMIADVFVNIGLVNLLSLPIIPVLDLFNMPSELARPIIISLVEVTRGILELSALSTPISVKIAIATGIISFGGLSITMQSITFLSKCKIKPSFYLLSKFTQAVISFFVAILITLVIKP